MELINIVPLATIVPAANFCGLSTKVTGHREYHLEEANNGTELVLVTNSTFYFTSAVELKGKAKNDTEIATVLEKTAAFSVAQKFETELELSEKVKSYCANYPETMVRVDALLAKLLATTQRIRENNAAINENAPAPHEVSEQEVRDFNANLDSINRFLAHTMNWLTVFDTADEDTKSSTRTKEHSIRIDETVIMNDGELSIIKRFNKAKGLVQVELEDGSLEKIFLEKEGYEWDTEKKAWVQDTYIDDDDDSDFDDEEKDGIPPDYFMSIASFLQEFGDQFEPQTMNEFEKTVVEIGNKNATLIVPM